MLLDVAETLHGSVHNHGFPELGDVYAAALDIRLAPDLAGRIELCRAGLIRITPANLRCFSSDDTTS